MSTLDRLPNAVASNKEYDEFIAHRLKLTRQYVRTNDLLLASVTGLTLLFGYMFAFVLIDHWIIPGGLGPLWRTILLLGVVGVIVTWTIRRLASPMNKKVTALFAASRLELAAPEMKNSLLTLVDLQTNRRQTSSEIAYALKRRACRELADVDLKAELESRELIGFSYALAALIVIMLLYAFVSPKSLFQSAYRAAVPFTSINAPTTTRITDVAPGSVDVLSGSQLEVIAHLEGKRPEQVRIEYSTTDQQILNEPVTMTLVDELLNKYTGVITGPNGAGIRQPMTYHVIAGDARSAEYTIHTQQLPIASIDSIQIKPPAYTGVSSTEQSIGHLDVWEGSVITLKTSVEPAAKSAIVKFSDTDDHSLSAEEIPLKGSGKSFTGTWPPLMLRSDGTYARFYHIEAVNDSGNSHPHPALHSISLRIDKRPEVTLVTPKGELNLPVNDTLALKILARDPDFKLSSIWLNIAKDQETIHRSPLWEGSTQSVSLDEPFELSQLLVEPGDQLQLWIEVNDNREPQPNRRLSDKVILNLLAAETPEQLEERQQQRKVIEQEEQNPAEQSSAQKDKTELVETDQPQPGENPSESSEAMDSQTNDPESKESAQQKPQEGEPSQNGETSTQQSGENKTDQSQQERNESSDQSQEMTDNTGDGAEGQQPAEQPLRNDGEDDDLALEEIIRKYQENKPQQSGDQQPEANENKPPQNPNATPDQQQQHQDKSNPAQQPQTPQEQMTSPEQSSQQEQSASQNQPGTQDETTQPSDPGKSDPAGSDENPQQQQTTTPDQSNAPTDPEGKNDTPGSMTEQASENENSPAEKGEQTGGNKPAQQPNEAIPDQQPGMNQQPGEQDNSDPDSNPGEPVENPQTEGAPKPAEKPASNAEQMQQPQQTDPNQKPTTQSEDKPQQPNPDQQNQPGQPSNPMNQQNQPGQQENNPSNSQPQNSEPGNSPQSSDQNSPAGSQQSKSSQGSQSSDSSEQMNDPNSNSPPAQDGQQNSSQNKPSSDSPQNSTNESQQKGTENPTDQPSQNQPGQESSNQQPGQEMQNGTQPSGDQDQSDSAQKPSSQQPSGQQPSNEQSQNQPSQNQPGQESGGSSTPGSSSASDSPNSSPGTGAEPGQGSSTPQQGGQPDGGNAVGGDNGPESEPGPGAGTGNGSGEGTPSPTTDNTLQDKKKAADLALKQLEDDLQRGEVDQDLLDQLGWTKKDLNRFLDRLNRQRLNRDPLTQEEVNRQKQYEELLKGLKLNRTSSDRTGGTQHQFDVDSFAPNRQTTPLEYREWEEAFRNRLLEQVGD